MTAETRAIYTAGSGDCTGKLYRRYRETTVGSGAVGRSPLRDSFLFEQVADTMPIGALVHAHVHDAVLGRRCQFERWTCAREDLLLTVNEVARELPSP